MMPAATDRQLEIIIAIRILVLLVITAERKGILAENVGPVEYNNSNS
jgi:hypothetical protein